MPKMYLAMEPAAAFNNSAKRYLIIIDNSNETVNFKKSEKVRFRQAIYIESSVYYNVIVKKSEQKRKYPTI